MKRILSLAIVFIICFFPTALAYPPISSGEVTGAWLENRGSYSHRGLDIALPEGSPVYAPFDGVVEGAAGAGYVYWVTITSPNGDCLLFGDLSFDSDTCARGEVKEGELIGYVGGAYKGPEGTSTGAHTHVEYHPYGHGNGTVDPTAFLQMLGVDLNGYTGSGNSGLYGTDNTSISWSIQGMYEIGNDLNATIKTFATAANKAFTYVKTGVLSYTGAICIFDLVIPIIVSGMGFSRRKFTQKLMKYAGLFGIILCWNHFTDTMILKFATATAGVVGGNSSVIAENMSQPQLLLQQGIRLISPALNKIGTFTMFEYLHNLGSILPIYAFTFITLGVFIAVAIYITIVYIEFYISASLSVVTVPFAGWQFTKFLPEGTVGHLVSSGLKLLLVSIMVGICVTCVKDSNPTDMFTTKTPGITATGTGQTIGPADLVSMADAMAEQYGVPTNLFEALIQTESSWNPNAVSGAGAQGLGQLMPDTAAGLGCTDPFDPQQNLMASAKYLKSLYDEYGDWDYALAAYNGGPGNVPKGEAIDPLYVAYINQVKGNLNGSYISHSAITAEQLTTFMRICLSLCAFALLILFVPKALMKQLGGPIEIHS